MNLSFCGMPDPSRVFSSVFWTGVGAMLIIVAVIAVFWLVLGGVD